MIYIIGIAVLIAAIAFILVGYIGHLNAVMKDIIAEEKRKAWADADAEIERRAEERAKEILNSIQYNKRVQLVNESDINWGE